jgi:fluoroacetyl-CoA thioesterase
MPPQPNRNHDNGYKVFIVKATVRTGLTGEHSMMVAESHLVPALYPEFETFQIMPPVFATGFLVGFIEWACVETLNPHLDDYEQSLGTEIDISHEAATPAGQRVTATVECVGVEGRRLSWAVEVRDEKNLISRGRHERFVIDRERFMASLGGSHEPL